MWNNLPSELTSIGSSASFKHHLKRKLQTKPNPIYQSGMGHAFINLSRIRMGLSGLKSQLYEHGIIPNNYCINCPNTPETPIHYFIECPRFAVQRELYFRELRHTYPNLMDNPFDDRQIQRLVNIIIYGDDEVNSNQNQSIQNATTSFIMSTKRF